MLYIYMHTYADVCTLRQDPRVVVMFFCLFFCLICAQLFYSWYTLM